MGFRAMKINQGVLFLAKVQTRQVIIHPMNVDAFMFADKVGDCLRRTVMFAFNGIAYVYNEQPVTGLPETIDFFNVRFDDIPQNPLCLSWFDVSVLALIRGRHHPHRGTGVAISEGAYHCSLSFLRFFWQEFT